MNAFNWVSLIPTAAPGRVPQARWDRLGPRDLVAAAWTDSLYLGKPWENHRKMVIYGGLVGFMVI